MTPFHSNKSSSLYIYETQRFGVLEIYTICHNDSTSDRLSSLKNFLSLKTNCINKVESSLSRLPIIHLYDIFKAHQNLRKRQRHNESNSESPETVDVGNTPQILFDALVQHGFLLIKVPKGQAATVIQDMRISLYMDLFPIEMEHDMTEKVGTRKNRSNLATSSTIYVSERGIPMYKLGYELCEGDIREMFRVAAGEPGTVTWPFRRQIADAKVIDTSSMSTESIWMRGIGLLRHVTDTVLDLLLFINLQLNSSNYTSTSNISRRHRPNSGASAWSSLQDGIDVAIRNTDKIKIRPNDFSVLYTMHYFNDGATAEGNLAVKAHVDPSLLVVEPFLCPSTSGLQIWDRARYSQLLKNTNTKSIDDNYWIDCDGPDSPMYQIMDDAVQNGEEVMLLFGGKALSGVIPTIEPTLHRVVEGVLPRRTVIYEQKYAEFYPPPSFD